MGSLSWFSAAFWGFTFILVGVIALAAATGGYNLTRVVLVTTAVYAVVGVIYGAWAAYAATARDKLE